MKQHLSIFGLAGATALILVTTGCSGGAGSGGGNGSNPGASIGTSCHARSRLVIPRLESAKLALPMSMVPKAVQSFSDQGKYDETKQLPVTVSLDLHNEADLLSRLTEIYTPGTPNFGHYMTPAEFRAAYAPTQSEVAKVESYLSSNGVQGLAVNDNGYMISGSASVKSLNSMLKTEIHQYKDASGNSYFAPSAEPSLPQGLPIQGIHGLDDVMHAHSYATKSAAGGKSGTGHSGGFAPADIRAAYNMPSSVDGAGQTLAVFELDAYNQSDITAYEQYYNLPNVTVTPISVDGASTTSPGGGITEVELDIELQLALAPGASKILVYEGPNSSQGILDTYAKIANDNQAKEISTSWGGAEGSESSSDLQSENTIFMQMAAQGQSIFSAAGDSGANDNGSSLSIDDPSGQPYMTAVGGTSLTTGTNQAWQSETTWTSGGGGVSSVWSMPGWQQGLAMGSNKASSSMRNIPDVSIDADPATGYDVYTSGGWSTWGGTSAAAPLWAAFTALVNQQRLANGMGYVGFINPTIYAIGEAGLDSTDFHDIADGSTNGYYPAVTGFDDATGWGSPNGHNLFNSLTSGSGC